jgi:hypothetical protein
MEIEAVEVEGECWVITHLIFMVTLYFSMYGENHARFSHKFCNCRRSMRTGHGLLWHLNTKPYGQGGI